MSSRRDSLDPDALAALEEERDFLLHSLDDLEREHEAGDLDDADYHNLRDDYTHRAAVVLQAIEERHAARDEAVRSPSPVRVVLAAVAVVVFAGVAGLAVARAAGLRLPGEGITGGVRETTGQRLFRCQQLAMAGEVRDSLECYDQIIEDQPANAEAITYRAWTLAVYAGMPQLAWPYFEEAVAVDPAYPDARAFRAIVLGWWCRPEEVLAELDAFEVANPLPEMRMLVEEQGQLRQRATELLEVRRSEPAVADPPAPVASSDPDEWNQCPVLADAGVLEPLENLDGVDE